MVLAGSSGRPDWQPEPPKKAAERWERCLSAPLYSGEPAPRSAAQAAGTAWTQRGQARGRARRAGRPCEPGAALAAPQGSRHARPAPAPARPAAPGAAARGRPAQGRQEALQDLHDRRDPLQGDLRLFRETFPVLRVPVAPGPAQAAALLRR